MKGKKYANKQQRIIGTVTANLELNKQIKREQTQMEMLKRHDFFSCFLIVKKTGIHLLMVTILCM